MAKPTPIQPVEEGLIPPEDIIATLPTHINKPVQPDVQPSTALFDSLEEPIQTTPLTWKELIPTAPELRKILGEAAIWMGSLIIVVGVYLLAFQRVTPQPVQQPVDSIPQMDVQPSIPASTQSPTSARRHRMDSVPAQVVIPKSVLPVPENMTARLYSPTMVELNWTPVGDGYQYRLYSALTPFMKDARPETDKPIVGPHYAWEPQRDADAMWLSVSSVDSKGQESDLSQPLYIRLR